MDAGEGLQQLKKLCTHVRDRQAAANAAELQQSCLPQRLQAAQQQQHLGKVWRVCASAAVMLSVEVALFLSKKEGWWYRVGSRVLTCLLVQACSVLLSEVS